MPYIHRFGFPCEHFFRVTASVPLHHHIHVQYWHTYPVFYDSGCDLGEVLQKAQRQLFEREGWGVQVDSEILNAALEKNGNTDKVFPHLFEGTKPSDYEEAKFVARSDAVMYSHLELFWLGENDLGDNDVDFTTECDEDVDGNYSSGSSLLRNNHSTHLTATTKRLHENLTKSVAEEADASLTAELVEN